MWTCSKCHAVSEDLYTICPKCGASRSAGRFGSSAQPAVRSVCAPAPEDKQMPPKNSPEISAQTPAAPAAYYEPDLSKVQAGRGVRISGRILIVLLPLITLAYFAAQYNRSLFASVRLAFFSDAEKLPAFVPIIPYILIAFAAALISALPGVWTLSIGKILKRLARMEELL